MKFCR